MGATQNGEAAEIGDIDAVLVDEIMPAAQQAGATCSPAEPIRPAADVPPSPADSAGRALNAHRAEGRGATLKPGEDPSATAAGSVPHSSALAQRGDAFLARLVGEPVASMARHFRQKLSPRAEAAPVAGSADAHAMAVGGAFARADDDVAGGADAPPARSPQEAPTLSLSLSLERLSRRMSLDGLQGLGRQPSRDGSAAAELADGAPAAVAGGSARLPLLRTASSMSPASPAPYSKHVRCPRALSAVRVGRWKPGEEGEMVWTPTSTPKSPDGGPMRRFVSSRRPSVHRLRRPHRSLHKDSVRPHTHAARMPAECVGSAASGMPPCARAVAEADAPSPRSTLSRLPPAVVTPIPCVSHAMRRLVCLSPRPAHSRACTCAPQESSDPRSGRLQMLLAAHCRAARNIAERSADRRRPRRAGRAESAVGPLCAVGTALRKARFALRVFASVRSRPRWWRALRTCVHIATVRACVLFPSGGRACCWSTCVLQVACCVLRVACCLLRVACCLFHVACCLVRAACCLLYVACCLLYAARAAGQPAGWETRRWPCRTSFGRTILPLTPISTERHSGAQSAVTAPRAQSDVRPRSGRLW